MTPALFVARKYKIDRRIIQPVEQRQHYPAGITKHCLHTLFKERIDDNLCACFYDLPAAAGGFVG